MPARLFFCLLFIVVIPAKGRTSPVDTVEFYTWGPELTGNAAFLKYSNCNREVYLSHKIKYTAVGGCIISSRKELFLWQIHNLLTSARIMLREGPLWKWTIRLEVEKCMEARR